MRFLFKSSIGVAIAVSFIAYGITDWRFWATFVLASLLIPTPRRAAYSVLAHIHTTQQILQCSCGVHHVVEHTPRRICGSSLQPPHRLTMLNEENGVAFIQRDGGDIRKYQ